MSSHRAVRVLAAGVILGCSLLTGCNRNPADGKASGIGGTGAEVTGDAYESSGTGGVGAGPTGTGGDQPGSIDQGATTPNDNP